MVMDTDAMMMLPICPFDSPRSSRTTGISGAMPNHPKKQTKKVIHVRWKVRIGTLLKSNRLMEVEGWVTCIVLRICYVIKVSKIGIYFT